MPGEGETTIATIFPTLAWRLHPSPRTSPIECTHKTVAPVKHIAPPHAHIRWATSENVCGFPGQSRQRPECSLWHLSALPKTLPTPHAPRQLLTKRGPAASRAAPGPLGLEDSIITPPHHTKSHMILENPTTLTQTNTLTSTTTQFPHAPTPNDF